MVYIIDKTNKPWRGTKSRSYDYKELKKSLRSKDPGTRASAHKAMENIRKEDKMKTSMRESLIKAHRNQDHNEIKDINDYVSKRKKYQNE